MTREPQPLHSSSPLRACVIIPARHASSRFPGKPLTPLLGKPMVLWVAELSAQAVGREHVYVATEDGQIAEVAKAAGFSVVMTSATALTGTDRVAEAAHIVNYDIYVNVQGDEPLVDPQDIRRCIEVKRNNPGMVVNAYCWLSDREDPDNVNLPKVVVSETGIMAYMSRKALPGFKELRNAPARYMKQICIYGFTRGELAAFVAFGRKGCLEACEDIEILRFLELGKQVLMFEARAGSLAVDVPEDVARVEVALRRLNPDHEPRLET